MVTIPFFNAEMHRRNGNEENTGKNHTNAKWKGEGEAKNKLIAQRLLHHRIFSRNKTHFSQK